MLQVGGIFRYRCGDYIYPHTRWKIEEHTGTYWVARSMDSFELQVYVNDLGRHIGSRELGMYENEVDVWMVPIL